jgi:hypothetical protein
MFDIVTKWEKRVSELIKHRQLFSEVDKSESQNSDSTLKIQSADPPKKPKRRTRQIATALFFGRATKDHLDWVTSHHSTYHLATGFLVTVPFIYVGVLARFVIPNAETWAHTTVFALLCLLAALIVCYFLLVLAVERYLYTYESTLRFVAVCLDEQSSKYLAA